MLSMRKMRNIHLTKQVRIPLLIATFFFGVFTHSCYGTPLNNVYDTQPIYSVFGADKFFKRKTCSEVRFIISPLYQQTSTVRNNAGTKVPAGDRLGRWNLFGLFFGPEGAPTPLNFSDPFTPGETFHNVRVAQRAAETITIRVPIATTDRYRIGPVTLPSPTTPNEIFPGGLTNEQNFDPTRYPFAYVSVPLDYEKIGVRSQVNIDFAFGLGFSVKGGVVDVKQAPSRFILDPQFAHDAGFPSSITTTSPAQDVTDATQLYNALYDPRVLEDISEDISFDLRTYRKTEAEDVHAQVYWHFPIDFKDKSGDLAVTMIPYLAAGLWIPTSDNLDQNRAFAVPTGNDGFTCFTADVNMAFDFPILPTKKYPQTLQGAFGGGILLGLNSRTQLDQRLPSSEYQVGLIPWKVPNITRRLGLTWYLNLSAKSEEFIEGLSIYFDFLYTKHLQDKITFHNLSQAASDAFQEGLEEYLPRTSWKNQQVNVGFNYRLADQVSLGGAIQAHISGIRVYRSVTLLGGVTVTF